MFDACELQRYIDDTALTGRVPPERLLDLLAFFAAATTARRWPGSTRLKLRPDRSVGRSPGMAFNLHGLALMFAGTFGRGRRRV